MSQLIALFTTSMPALASWNVTASKPITVGMGVMNLASFDTNIDAVLRGENPDSIKAVLPQLVEYTRVVDCCFSLTPRGSVDYSPKEGLTLVGDISQFVNMSEGEYVRTSTPGLACCTLLGTISGMIEELRDYLDGACAAQTWADDLIELVVSRALQHGVLLIDYDRNTDNVTFALRDETDPMHFRYQVEILRAVRSWEYSPSDWAQQPAQAQLLAALTADLADG